MAKATKGKLEPVTVQGRTLPRAQDSIGGGFFGAKEDSLSMGQRIALAIQQERELSDLASVMSYAEKYFHMAEGSIGVCGFLVLFEGDLVLIRWRLPRDPTVVVTAITSAAGT